MNRLLLIILFFVSTNLASQDCNCDVLLSNLSTDNYNIIDGTTIDYEIGDTICIPSGTYAGIQFVNIKGAPNDFSTITNCGGQVIILEEIKSGITFRNSAYIHLTGTGSSEYEYGIKISMAQGPGAVGINMSELSTDFEIDFIEIFNTNFAGILGKTDPKCNDLKTWRRSGYVLRNLNIHHNYIHDTGGEGIYLGYTGGYLVQSNLQCEGEFVFGHWLENIKIHQNTFERIGWDAIQVNLARKFGSIHDNTILSYGLRNKTFQNFGMSIGGGHYAIFNNLVINPDGGNGQGIQLLSAKSDSKVFNNVIINPNFHGIFIHNRHAFDDSGKGYLVANNTIIEPKKSGIFYNTTITKSKNLNLIGTNQSAVPSYFINNLIVNPGNTYEDTNTWKGNRENYLDFNEIETRDRASGRILTNLFTRRMDTLCLASIGTNDYRPGHEGSPLVDKGSSLIFGGVLFDMLNIQRPKNTIFDIGAFEFDGEIFNVECAESSDEPSNAEAIETSETIITPNPAKNNVRFINSEQTKATISIFSQSGNLLKTSEYEFGQSYDIGNLSSGTYLVKFDFKDGMELHKLIVR